FEVGAPALALLDRLALQLLQVALYRFLDGVGELVSRLEEHGRLARPPRRAWVLVLLGGLPHQEGGVPLVGEDHGPEEPEPAPRVDQQRGVAVRKAGRVRHHERLAPPVLAAPLPRPEDADVIRLPLPRAPVPAREQVPVRTLHDTARM